MKVLHVIPSVSPVHGGPSRAIVNMERALAKRGVDVTTVTTNDDGDSRTLPVRCGEPVADAIRDAMVFSEEHGVLQGIGRTSVAGSRTI